VRVGGFHRPGQQGDSGYFTKSLRTTRPKAQPKHCFTLIALVPLPAGGWIETPRFFVGRYACQPLFSADTRQSQRYGADIVLVIDWLATPF